jgi:hypothetical protein
VSERNIESGERWVETLTGSCGHEKIVAMFGGPPENSEWRREKHRARPCLACAAARDLELQVAQKRSAAEARARRIAAGEPVRVKKGQEVKDLPSGARLGLVRGDDGSWTGILSVPGSAAVECSATGLMSLVSKLARRHLAERGAKLRGRVG